MHLWAWVTQAAPRAARQSELVACMPIGTSHVRSTSCRVFPSPPHVAFFGDRGVRRGFRDRRSRSVRCGSGVRPISIRPPTWKSTYAGAWRNAMRGWGDVASDNRHACNQLRLGASSEARLAWPNLTCASGQLCKPSRSTHPRVVFRQAPACARPVPWNLMSRFSEPVLAPITAPAASTGRRTS